MGGEASTSALPRHEQGTYIASRPLSEGDASPSTMSELEWMNTLAFKKVLPVIVPKCSIVPAHSQQASMLDRLHAGKRERRQQQTL